MADDIRPRFVQLASDKNQKLWESLSDRQKSLLESQASLRTLETTEQANRFFESREANLIKPTKFAVARPATLNESYDPVTAAMKHLRS